MVDMGRGPRAGRRAIVLGGGGRSWSWTEQAGDVFAAWYGRLAAALHAEADAARLAPWLAVGFGAGIILYFAAPAEPSLAGPLIVLLALVAVAWASRERPFAFALSLALIAITAGFAAGCIRGALITHPLLTRATGTVTLTGFVEARDGTERSDRIVLRLTGKEGPGADRVPERVRVAIRKGTAPAVGDHVELRARLRPLIGPARPGGFDFARNGYFSGFGATGFVLGRATVTPPPTAVPFDIRVRAAVSALRFSITARIRTALPGESGAVAAALVTGIRDGIPAAVNEVMRVSGLAHVLAISGLHMVLVVGTIFGAVRGALALVPGLALRRPIKKWAAVVALIGALGYLVISGAAVSTQRAFVMVGVVLIGVIVDRPALTLRTLAAAAIVLLALSPEALLNPSFQMSFAATLALVALFERLTPFMARPPLAGSGTVARTSERFGRWLLLGAATSLAAGLATAIYAAFHFHRVAPYGLLSNVLAMPVLSFVIMPAGLLSVLLTPFGYDALGWKVMGFGIELMLSVARWVAELPGAEGRVSAFGAGPVLLATIGLLLISIPVTRLRYAGVPLLLAAFFMAAATPKPDVLVDAEGRTVALRGADGRLSIFEARRNRFTAENWLAGDGDPRRAADEPGSAFQCGRSFCTARLIDGTRLVVPRDIPSLPEACREGGLMVTHFYAPRKCGARVIDRRVLGTTGAIAMRFSNGEWIAEAARAPDSDRPWFGRPEKANPRALERVLARPEPSPDNTREARDTDDVPTPELPDGEDDQ